MSTGLDCHALVIGIDDYGGGISPLQSAVRDATAIAGILRAEHKYSVTCLCDCEAAGSAIESHLTDTLPPKLSRESGFLLYFAGHGVAIGDGTQGPQGYLLPQDARPGDEDSWVSMETLRSALESLPCRHLFIILDCCFAGSFRWAATRGLSLTNKPLYDSQFERYLKGDAWQALTSASHDERAADLSPGRENKRDADGLEEHSPFAAALIRGLSGGADSSRAGFEPDGVITATELYQYIFEELAPQGGESIQTPGIWPLRPDNKGEFIFLNPGAELNTVPDPPLDDENNPWLGLEAYSMGDAGLFFGRQRVVDDLLARVLDESATSLLAVVGASGTGKSSVVKAGLLPLLADPPDDLIDRVGEWTVIQAPRLTGDPGQQLDEVQKDLDNVTARQRAIVLFDQFEELYTQCPDNDARASYLERLRTMVETDGGPTILVTLRSDFEPRPASAESLQDLWQAARFVVPAFSHEELREVIEGPANVRAIFFEPAELVGKLLDEIIAMPGALPLLSFALAEMYRQAQLRRRESGSADRALTLEDYELTGGVVGALHKRATLLFENADDRHRETIRRVFLRMLSQDGARLTRRRVNLAELRFGGEDEQGRVDSVVKRFVDARLLVIDGEYVEPAHDTLVVAWEKLQDWLAAAGSQELVRSVWRDARQWQAHRQDKTASGFLWNNDPRLPQMETMLPELNRLEQEFVEASTAKKKRQRNWTVGITASVIAILVVATVFSYLQFSAANVERRAALVQAGNTGWQRAISARDFERDDVSAAHLFAASAAAFAAAGEPDRARNSLTAINDRVLATFPHDEHVDGAMFNGDESWILSWGWDDTARLWDAGQREPLNTFRHENWVLGASFNGDGSRVLSWSSDLSVRLWDPAQDAPLRTFHHEYDVSGASFEGDGSRLLIWSYRMLQLWDPVEETPVRTFEHEDTVRGVIVYDGGSRILSWSLGTIRIWDPAQDEPLNTFQHDHFVNGALFNSDRSRVLSWSDDKTVRLWDPAQGVLLRTFKHDGAVSGALFNGDESRVLSWSDDRTVRLWDPAEDAPLKTLQHDDDVWGASFNVDGSRVLSWSYVTGAVRLWDPADGTLLRDYRHDGQVRGALFAGDGSRVLSWGSDNTARLWDPAQDEPLRSLSHDGPVSGASFNGDGSRVLSWSNDSTVRVWDLGRDAPLRTFRHDGVYYALINGDGSRVLSWSGDTPVRLWDPAQEDPLKTLEHDRAVRGVLFNGDESQVLSWSDDGTLRLWDPAQGAPLKTFQHESVWGAVFSGDGSQIVSWGSDGTVNVWDPEQDTPTRTFEHVAVYGALFDDAGSRVLSFGEYGMIRLWDPMRDAPLRTFRHDGVVSGASFNGEGSRVLTWSDDDTMRLWSPTQDEPLRTFEHETSVSTAMFNSDGSRILSISDGTIQLWDPEQNEPLRTFEHDGVYGATFRGDGSQVLSWSRYTTVRLWGPEQDEPLRTFEHDHNVNGATFNDDGSRVLSWSVDNTVRLWDPEQDAPLRTFRHDSRVLGAMFGGDGSRVLSWSDDGTVRLWEIPVFDDVSVEAIDMIKLDLEVRTAATITDQGAFRLLTYDEWLEKREQLYQEVDRD